MGSIIAEIIFSQNLTSNDEQREVESNQSCHALCQFPVAHSLASLSARLARSDVDDLLPHRGRAEFRQIEKGEPPPRRMGRRTADNADTLSVFV